MPYTVRIFLKRNKQFTVSRNILYLKKFTKEFTKFTLEFTKFTKFTVYIS